MLFELRLRFACRSTVRMSRRIRSGRTYNVGTGTRLELSLLGQGHIDEKRGHVYITGLDADLLEGHLVRTDLAGNLDLNFNDYTYENGEGRLYLLDLDTDGESTDSWPKPWLVPSIAY